MFVAAYYEQNYMYFDVEFYYLWKGDGDEYAITFQEFLFVV